MCPAFFEPARGGPAVKASRAIRNPGGEPYASEYSIAALKEKDALAVAELEGRCFSTAWGRERYEVLLRAVDELWDKAVRGQASFPSFLALGLRKRDGIDRGNRVDRGERVDRTGQAAGIAAANGPDEDGGFFAGQEGKGAAEQALIGYITVGLYAAVREVEIYNIAVAPECRGQGLGAFLLAGALGDLARLGFTRAVLEVREHNAPALALYASAGFRQCGLRKGYYADTGEDALVLEAELRVG